MRLSTPWPFLGRSYQKVRLRRLTQAWYSENRVFSCSVEVACLSCSASQAALLCKGCVRVGRSVSPVRCQFRCHFQSPDKLSNAPTGVRMRLRQSDTSSFHAPRCAFFVVLFAFRRTCHGSPAFPLV